MEWKKTKGKLKVTKKGASSKANKKALALLLKPASPTPSNTGSLRSFHRDTEKIIKVLLYCEVLQRGGKIKITGTCLPLPVSTVDHMGWILFLNDMFNLFYKKYSIIFSSWQYSRVSMWILKNLIFRNLSITPWNVYSLPPIPNYKFKTYL